MLWWFERWVAKWGKFEIRDASGRCVEIRNWFSWRGFDGVASQKYGVARVGEVR